MNDKKYQDDFDRNEEKTITDRLDAYKKDLEDELKKDFPYDRRVRKLKSDIARDQIYLDNHKKERKMHKINPFTDEELGFKKTKS